MEKIRVLTLWQPWASMIADGVKVIETRKTDWFRCLEGHRLGIHAAVAYDKDFAARLYVEDSRKRNDVLWRYNEVNVSGRKLVCTAMVREARWLNERDSEGACLAAKGLFGLVLDDVRKIDPEVIISGKQGIWFYNWDGDLGEVGARKMEQKSLF